MKICRIIGWILILLALAAAGYEIFAAIEAKSYRFKAFGELWYMIDRGNHNLFQATIQRYIWPILWDGFIAHILLMPAWVVLSVPGTLVIWLCRRRRRRHRSSKRVKWG